MAILRKKLTRKSRAATLAATDFARLDAMTEEEIARQISDNHDAAPDRGDASAAEVYGGRLAALRLSLGLSQAAFAERYEIPVASLRDWEQGRRTPDAASRAYLRLIAQDARGIARALIKSRRRKVS